MNKSRIGKTIRKPSDATVVFAGLLSTLSGAMAVPLIRILLQDGLQPFEDKA